MKRNYLFILIGIVVVMMFFGNVKKEAGEIVTRTLPTSATAGSNVQITLTATNVGASYFAIVREDIPAGWSWVQGGSQEGTQVKGLISSMMGNTFTYTLQAPASGTYTFTGTQQFSDAAATSPIVGSSQITIGGACTDSCATLGYACGAFTICGTATNCGSCPTGKTCISGQCITNCVPDTTCAANTCIGQTCSDGCGNLLQGTKTCTCTPDCNCALATCIGQTCTNGCGGSCPGQLSCAASNTTCPNVWELYDTTQSKCVMSQWVWIIGAFMAFILLVNLIK